MTILLLGCPIYLFYSTRETAPNNPLVSLLTPFLSMQYHQIIIFFHRPWVSKSYIQPRSPRQGPGYHHARRMCIESATAVARLLHIYEKHYTFRRMNNQVVAIIFSAALMLLFVTVSSSPLMPSKPGETNQPHPRNAEMVAYLNLCFRALDELGQSFENAKRTRDYLVTLQRRWQAHMRRSGPAKRQIGSANIRPSSLQRAAQSSETAHNKALSDPSRKKSRLSATDTLTEHDSKQTASLASRSTAAPSRAHPPSGILGSHHESQPSHPQPNHSTVAQPGDFDWIHTADLNMMPTNNGIEATPGIINSMLPHFPDEPSMLPDLGDMEAWWGSSPNGTASPGAGGPSL